MSMLLLDVPMVDYVRFTSYAAASGKRWWRWAVDTCIAERAIFKEQTFMQYEGKSYPHPLGGSVFSGVGEQAQGSHHLFHASGNAADVASIALLDSKFSDGERCTRVDLQITTTQPRDWSQLDLFNAMKGRGRNVNFVSSKDRETQTELATVYIGSRSSDRVIRLYQKLTAGGELLLRFEVEYKGDRAHRVATVLSANRRKMRDYLLHEIQTTGSRRVEAVFSAAVMGASPDKGRLKKVKGSVERTGDWLKTGVLPAFERYVNDPNSNCDIIGMFADVLNEVTNE